MKKKRGDLKRVVEVGFVEVGFFCRNCWRSGCYPFYKSELEGLTMEDIRVRIQMKHSAYCDNADIRIAKVEP